MCKTKAESKQAITVFLDLYFFSGLFYLPIAYPHGAAYGVKRIGSKY